MYICLHILMVWYRDMIHRGLTMLCYPFTYFIYLKLIVATGERLKE